MKKTLSVIIAICILASMLPIFGVASAETTATQFSVDFTKVDKTTLGGSNGQFAVRGTNVKGPNWILLAHEAQGSTIFNKGSRVRFYADSYLQFGVYATDVASGYDSLVIEFTVPKKSFYDISGLFVRNTGGGYGDIYIDEVKQITYDFYAFETENKTEKITQKPIELSEGTHKIKITTRASQNDECAYACVYNFAFTPVTEELPDNFSVDFRTGDVDTMTPTEGWSSTNPAPGTTRYPNYLATSNGDGWSVDGANSTIADGKTMSYFSTYTSIATYSANGDKYVTFNFTVPEDGTYEVSAYAMHRTYGGYINYYIDGEFIGKFDCYAAKDDITTATSETFGKVKLSEGTHKLKLSAEKSSGANAMMLPVKVDFKKVITDDFNIDFRKGDISTMTPTEGYGTPNAVPGATRYPMYLATTKGDGWSVDGANSTIANGAVGSYFASYSSFATWNTTANRYITFDFNVSGEGTYDITAYGMHRPEGGYINYFIDGVYIGRFDCRADKADYQNATSTALRPMKLSPGAHKLTLVASGSGGTHSVMLPVKVTFDKSESFIAISSIEIESDKTELKKNETAYITGNLNFANGASIGLRTSKFNTGNTPLDGSADGTIKVTYQSSDSKVATVSETGVVTAVSGGVANITATVEIEGVSVTSDSVKVLVKDNSVPATITFAADSQSDIALEVDGTAKDYKKLSTVQIARGASVKVTAADIEGKRFVGWVRGSADYGRIVSASAEYEFTATTHTLLTAVYSDIPEDLAAVEYYNENGQYLETKAAADGKPEKNPTLVGYIFRDWWTAEETPLVLENVTALTRAVAKFAKTEAKFTVTISANDVSGAVSGDYFYDDEITLTSENGEVYWLRDGKVVDFGASYTFNVWGDTEITTAASGYDNMPKVVMDGVVKGDAYMIEYDAGNKEIIEVGIIFGATDAITIASCSEKMNSQRNSTHGQFTAQSDYSVAKGYLIYKDGGEYKVIYSK